MSKEIKIEEKINLSGVELEEEELVNLYLKRREEVLKIVEYGLKYCFNVDFIRRALWDFLDSGDISTAETFLDSKRKKGICLMRGESNVIVSKGEGRCYTINFCQHFTKERERLLEQLSDCPHKNIYRGFWVYDKIESVLKMSEEELEVLYEACGVNISTRSDMESKIRDFIGTEDFVEKVKQLIANVKKRNKARESAKERREKNYQEVKKEIDREIVVESQVGWITMDAYNIFVFTNDGVIYRSAGWPSEIKKHDFLYTLKKSNKIPASFREIGFCDIPKGIINELKEKKPEIAVEIRLSSE